MRKAISLLPNSQRADMLVPAYLWALLVATELAACVLLVGWSQPAQAAFPGQNGRIAFVSNGTSVEENPGLNFELFTIRPDGTDRRMVTHTDEARVQHHYPAWSPDGTKIAFSSNRGGWKHGWDEDIFTVNRSGTTRVITRLTDNAYTDVHPAWSPDGTKVVFVSNRSGRGEIWVMNADGTGQTQLTNDPNSDMNPAWSPDGTKIAFIKVTDHGDWELYVMNADGTGQRRFSDVFPIPHFCYRYDPDWSPDGTEIAFAYQCNSRPTIYAMSADGTAQRKVSVGSESNMEDPTWSPNGRRIAYRSIGVGDTYDIYTMKADGTGQITNLTNSSAAEYDPSWQPQPTLSR